MSMQRLGLIFGSIGSYFSDQASANEASSSTTTTLSSSVAAAIPSLPVARDCVVNARWTKNVDDPPDWLLKELLLREKHLYPDLDKGLSVLKKSEKGVFEGDRTLVLHECTCASNRVCVETEGGKKKYTRTNSRSSPAESLFKRRCNLLFSLRICLRP